MGPIIAATLPILIQELGPLIVTGIKYVEDKFGGKSNPKIPVPDPGPIKLDTVTAILIPVIDQLVAQGKMSKPTGDLITQAIETVLASLKAAGVVGGTGATTPTPPVVIQTQPTTPSPSIPLNGLNIPIQIGGMTLHLVA